MPLQKPHPQGTLPADKLSSKRRQLEGRRRTLHTISELCVTDGATPDFSSFIATKQKQQRSHTNTASIKSNAHHLNKRRSLPQYCSSPQCLQAQASVHEPPMYTSASHRSHSLQGTHTSGMSTHDEGWNARRERARIQREQAVGSSYRRQSLNHQPQDGSYPTLLRKAVPSTSRSSLRSYSSHHQLLANSRSISGFSSSSSSNGTLDRRSSLGTLAGRSDSRAFDAESSERASTDSSSYRSTHNNAIRRSRSGSSSSVSFTSPVAPPMPIPTVSPPPMQRYYSMPAHYTSNNTAERQSISTVHARPSSNTRTSSLPTIRIERAGQSNRHSQSDIQRARLESLAALTATQLDTQRTSPPRPTLSRRTSVSSQHSQPARPRSYSHLKPPPQYSALPPLHPGKDNKFPHAIHEQVNNASLEKRVVPRRESLTQWKAEREAAEPGGTRREHMKERVRRANELEQERERELMKMGKGTGMEGKEKKEGTGCFRGFLGCFGLGGR